jgi:hypothetical protein
MISTSTIKFEIETIADKVVAEIEDLHPQGQTLLLAKYAEIAEQFEKVKHLKQKHNTKTIDIVLVYENKSGQFSGMVKDEYLPMIAEIHNRINYKLEKSEKIQTFSRGKLENLLTFHFPADLNFWILSNNNFLSSKIKPLVLINIGIEGRWGQYKKKMLDGGKIIFVEDNPYFDFDKHVDENWRDEDPLTPEKKAKLDEQYGQDQQRTF